MQNNLWRKEIKQIYIEENKLFTIVLLCIYIGLCIQVSGIIAKIVCGSLLLLTLFINKKREYIITFYMLLFSMIMIFCSIKYIPGWVARTHNISTDSIWGRSSGFGDTLIFTLIKDKKCILKKDCWYYEYIDIFADEVTTDEEYEIIINQDTYSELRERCRRVGWMHIDADFLLIEEKALQRFRNGDEVYLYVDPEGLAEADTVIVLNDEEGNIYIESKYEWEKE